MAAVAAGIMGDVGSAAHDAALPRLRSVCLGALIAVPGLPLALSVLLPASTALPVGAALAVSGVLLAGAAAIGRERTACTPEIAAEPEAPAAAEISRYDLFAGLVTLHDVRGHVTAVHGRDREVILGWMRDPAGRGFLDQIHVSDRIGFLAAVDRLRQGEPGLSVDLRIERRRTGAEADQFVYMRTDLTALCGPDGALTAILAQSRDISQEAALRSESARKTAEAESANDAKTRFLAAVSHELRTPLNAILGFSDILAGEYFGRLENDRQREYVALIHQSGSHLLSVVNTMLDVSKIEAGRYELLPEAFSIAGSVEACEKMLGLQARDKGLQLTSRVARDVGEAVADQRAVQQVLINLVGNAIKFTDRGGIVTIDALREGGDLVLTVSDTGIGIPADKLDRIGQPFTQVENEYTRKYEGTGLGLSLVKGLVALHGGRFAIASDLGTGTVITVTLPADGSGIAHPAECGAGESPATVEFPPRLAGRGRTMAGALAPAAQASMRPARDDKEAGHDDTRAKTA